MENSIAHTPITAERRCFNCRYCATFDQGYSSYTVEDTVVTCLLDLNPDMPVSESYSWRYGNSETIDHPTFKVAESCPKYEFTTELTQIDVDGDRLDGYEDDPVLHALLKANY